MANRKLLDYLPEYMQEYSEMRLIMDVQQTDIDAFHEGINRIWANQFLSDADEYGVGRWENILAITPKATDTLDERKFRILAWWTQELPYTITKLEEMLKNLCRDGNYAVVNDNDNYKISIKLGLSNEENYNDVVSLLQRIVPANMICDVYIAYNRWSRFESMTWSELEASTWENVYSDRKWQEAST